eukprot:s244_g10.t1
MLWWQLLVSKWFFNCFINGLKSWLNIADPAMDAVAPQLSAVSDSSSDVCHGSVPVPRLSGSDERDIDVQIERLEPFLVEKIAQMEIVRPEVMRVTPAYRAFQQRAAALRVGVDGDFFSKSYMSHQISTFWSHSWHSGHWKKIITLITIYNGPAASVLGMLAALVMMPLFCFDLLPSLDRGRTGPTAIGYSCWSLWSGFLVTSLVMMLWRPQSRVFLDRICISQTDVQLKTEAILSLAGLLKRSDSMLILWDPSWTERLWCLFELAAFLRSKKDLKKELIIRPTFLGPVQIAVFLTCVAGMIPLTMAPMDVAYGPTSLVVPSVFMCLSGFVVFYVAMSTLRGYFRDLDIMAVVTQTMSAHPELRSFVTGGL